MVKIVKESLNEIISFERGGDPLSKLGIGRRKLIEDWLNEMKIMGYAINENFTIDTHIGTDLSHKNLTKFPDFIKFNISENYFNCDYNQLISLRGCPEVVGEGLTSFFSCCYNQLSSLEGCPKKVFEFWSKGNKVNFSKIEVLNLCEVKEYRIYV